MTIADSRVVAWRCTKRTGKHVKDGGDIDPFVATNPAYVKAHPNHNWHGLVDISLLAEAERELFQKMCQLHETTMKHDALLTNRDALQSRLDAVLLIAGEMYVQGYNGNDPDRGPLYNFANRIRAAIGCATTGEKK